MYVVYIIHMMCMNIQKRVVISLGMGEALAIAYIYIYIYICLYTQLFPCLYVYNRILFFHFHLFARFLLPNTAVVCSPWVALLILCSFWPKCQKATIMQVLLFQYLHRYGWEVNLSNPMLIFCYWKHFVEIAFLRCISHHHPPVRITHHLVRLYREFPV